MLMGDFNFRPIEQKDNAAITELIRKTLKAYALDIPGTVYFDEGLDHLSDVYSGKDCAYYVIDDKNGKLIGGVGFARLSFMKDTATISGGYAWFDVTMDLDSALKEAEAALSNAKKSGKNIIMTNGESEE